MTYFVYNSSSYVLPSNSSIIVELCSSMNSMMTQSRGWRALECLGGSLIAPQSVIDILINRFDVCLQADS